MHLNAGMLMATTRLFPDCFIKKANGAALPPHFRHDYIDALVTACRGNA
jgi:hypothetical protein